MQIIRALQADGRRPYTSIAREVGLSEAAVRSRAQRLLDAGVMQIAAVTDPLRVGRHR
ncbi:MAG TPA: AsnC family transcriptional regulator, partial [Acidimicrobiia bacterium]|nr:AsnC family transcriptional regulator [Acidimicrobiia bacterium]